MSPVGKTKDAGWEIGVSRTVHQPPERVWEVLTSAGGTAIWLGEGTVLPTEPGSPFETAEGTVGEVRSFRPLDRLRLTWQPAGWDHDTTLQVTISPTSTGTRIGLHQERLADADERERQRQHWAAVMDELFALLGA
jgi:uncharacterized protein YndB with AHSA1/START domain